MTQQRLQEACQKTWPFGTMLSPTKRLLFCRKWSSAGCALISAAELDDSLAAQVSGGATNAMHTRQEQIKTIREREKGVGHDSTEGALLTSNMPLQQEALETSIKAQHAQVALLLASQHLLQQHQTTAISESVARMQRGQHKMQVARQQHQETTGVKGQGEIDKI
eukprot:CAMPEP_0173087464 /NCGR_PEP_ID=MMETSP1102-20130122/23905_1 /TAXON_ID=49646 /ORGANISM="Geminigera sp., Strain Caron Lab Isolate" /LENGTH=164 /DNA_ID=CAMNT_0013969283 /DNA_START=92 /DNA_END=586 /DNA_ORIENTATION=-